MEIMIETCVDDRIRLFSTIIALATGNAEIEEWAHPHPLRLATQAFLAPFESHNCTALFKRIIQQMPRGMPPANLMYWAALLLKTPPKLEWDLAEPPSEGLRDAMVEWFGSWIQDEPYRALTRAFLAPLVDVSEKLPALLSDFFMQTKLETFWVQQNRWWKDAVQQCDSILDSWRVAEWLGHFYGEPSRPLLLVPNPTDPPSDCFFASSRDKFYAIIGPPSVPKRMANTISSHEYRARPRYLAGVAVHEYSHALLRRHLKENLELVKGTQHLGKNNRLRGWFPSTYSTWEMQFEEIFIRACTALFWHDREGERAADEFLEREKEQHGIYLIDEFYQRLLQYSEGRQDNEYTDLSDYLDRWSQSLNRSMP